MKSEISIICFDQILLVMSVYDRQIFSRRSNVVIVLFMEGLPVCVSLLTLQVRVYSVGWNAVFVCDLSAEVATNPTAISSAPLLLFADCLFQGQHSLLCLVCIR